MKTSRAQIDRLLHPNNGSATIACNAPPGWSGANYACNWSEDGTANSGLEPDNSQELHRTPFLDLYRDRVSVVHFAAVSPPDRLVLRRMGFGVPSIYSICS